MIRTLACFLFLTGVLNSTATGQPAPAGLLDSLAVALEKSQTDTQHINLLNGMVYRVLDVSPATEFLITQQHRVLALARKARYAKGEADALTNLVRLYLNRYESSVSLEYALEALRLHEAMGDEEKASYNIMQLGVIYYTSQNYEKALEYYRLAISRFSKLGDDEKLAMLNYLSGLSHSKLGQFSAGLAELRRALMLMERLPENPRIVECLTGMSEIFLQVHLPDSALSYANRAMIYLDTTAKNNYGLAKINLIRSAGYRLKNEPTAALQHADSALALAQRVSARELTLEAYDAMTRALALNGDYRRAYEMHKAFLTLRDTLFNEKNMIRISRLEAEFQRAKTDQQIALLEREKKITNLLFLGTAAIALLVLTLSFVLFNRFQIKKKSNQQLKEAYDQLTETQEQLLHHKKMASLGRLATGLSHEIQNPLNFVNNFSEISQELLEELKQTGLDPDQEILVLDLLESNSKVNHHGKRAQQIIKRMQEHSNLSAGSSEMTDLNPLLSQCLDRVIQEFRSEPFFFECRVERSLDPSLPEITVQVSQFLRVWYNIFKNSFQAMQEKATGRAGYAPHISVMSRRDGDLIRITCHDNGVGMDEETRERAFEPLYTTKPAGSASGLGLSISYDIIKAHHGEIKVVSEKGEFSEFTVMLPVRRS